MTKTQANAEEIRLIALYGRIKLDEDGVLFNRTLGGDGGTPGHKRRQKRRERVKRGNGVKRYWDSPVGQARKLEMSKRARAQIMNDPQAMTRITALGKSGAAIQKRKPFLTKQGRSNVSKAISASNKRRVWTDEARASVSQKAMQRWEKRKEAALDHSRRIYADSAEPG